MVTDPNNWQNKVYVYAKVEVLHVLYFWQAMESHHFCVDTYFYILRKLHTIQVQAFKLLNLKVGVPQVQAQCSNMLFIRMQSSEQGLIESAFLNLTPQKNIFNPFCGWKGTFVADLKGVHHPLHVCLQFYSTRIQIPTDHLSDMQVFQKIKLLEKDLSKTKTFRKMIVRNKITQKNDLSE